MAEQDKNNPEFDNSRSNGGSGISGGDSSGNGHGGSGSGGRDGNARSGNGSVNIGGGNYGGVNGGGHVGNNHGGGGSGFGGSDNAGGISGNGGNNGSPASVSRLQLEALASWASVRFNADTDTQLLIEKIKNSQSTYYAALDFDCLQTLCHIRDIKLRGDEDDKALQKRLKKSDSLRKRFKGKMRRWAASALSSMLGEHLQESEEASGNGKSSSVSLKRDVEHRGVAPALADRLKGAADEYISVKLDEIEQRIDAKLDQIDQRLTQWRDREIENRLKIIRLTLTASVIIALISVVYAWIKKHYGL